MASELVDYTQEQLAAIGCLAMGFGALERQVYGYLTQISKVQRDVADVLMGSLSFSNRCERLKALYKLCLPSERHEEMAKLIGELKVLSGRRNALLHFPPVPKPGRNVIWTDGEYPTVTEDERQEMWHEKTSGRLLTPGDVLKFASEVAQASERLTELHRDALGVPV